MHKATTELKHSVVPHLTPSPSLLRFLALCSDSPPPPVNLAYYLVSVLGLLCRVSTQPGVRVMGNGMRTHTIVRGIAHTQNSFTHPRSYTCEVFKLQGRPAQRELEPCGRAAAQRELEPCGRAAGRPPIVRPDLVKGRQLSGGEPPPLPHAFPYGGSSCECRLRRARRRPSRRVCAPYRPLCPSVQRPMKCSLHREISAVIATRGLCPGM